MSEAPSPKLLTVDEANQLLPSIILLIEQLQGLHASIVHTNEQIEAASAKLSAGNGYPIQELKQHVRDLSKHQRHLLEAFQLTIKEIDRLGGVVKDVTQGLIDFYGLREGEIVCLCWRLGEERIGYWHGLEDGFAGRQPIA